MQMSHKNSLEGHLDHAQMTNSTDYHVSQCSSVCPSDAAAAMLYAPPLTNPYPPGSWQANNAARFR